MHLSFYVCMLAVLICTVHCDEKRGIFGSNKCIKDDECRLSEYCDKDLLLPMGHCKLGKQSNLLISFPRCTCQFFLVITPVPKQMAMYAEKTDTVLPSDAHCSYANTARCSRKWRTVYVEVHSIALLTDPIRFSSAQNYDHISILIVVCRVALRKSSIFLNVARDF